MRRALSRLRDAFDPIELFALLFVIALLGLGAAFALWDARHPCIAYGDATCGDYDYCDPIYGVDMNGTPVMQGCDWRHVEAYACRVCTARAP